MLWSPHKHFQQCANIFKDIRKLLWDRMTILLVIIVLLWIRTGQPAFRPAWRQASKDLVFMKPIVFLKEFRISLFHIFVKRQYTLDLLFNFLCIISYPANFPFNDYYLVVSRGQTFLNMRWWIPRSFIHPVYEINYLPLRGLLAITQITFFGSNWENWSTFHTLLSLSP